MLIIAGALATLFNIIIILHKIKLKRFLDTLVDIGIFVALCAMFAGTIAGMQTGMIASMGVSLYLLAYPITFKGLFNG